MTAWRLDPDRCFSPEPSQRALARELYQQARGLPILSPHGHVSPLYLLEDEQAPDPATLLVIPDHYVLRMLYSQGVSLESMGRQPLDGGAFEADPRVVWRRFCAHFHLFAGTPTGLWLKHELVDLFGVDERPEEGNADRLYDRLVATLAEPAFRPRTLFRRFNIEFLSTTDGAADDLSPHASMRADDLPVAPTLRPDAVVDPSRADWAEALIALEARSGVPVDDYAGYLAAIRQRRAAFQALGATATDHAALTAVVQPLSAAEAASLYDALRTGRGAAKDAERFASHMLFELATMAADDGLVMQLHVGSLRNHHGALFRRFGIDVGADIPIATEWTRSLRPLLDALGAHPGFRLVLYGLDESNYARELAPLAGHYPALRLGAPWWFFDSVLGMERYLDATVETAGIANLAGFVDDTRAYPSIEARHDVWRRVVCDWVAGRTLRGLIDEDMAPTVVRALAYEQVKETFKLG